MKKSITEILLEQNSRFIGIIETYQKEQIIERKNYDSRMSLVLDILDKLNLGSLIKKYLDPNQDPPLREESVVESAILPPNYKIITTITQDNEILFAFIGLDGYMSKSYKRSEFGNLINDAWMYHEGEEN